MASSPDTTKPRLWLLAVGGVLILLLVLVATLGGRSDGGDRSEDVATVATDARTPATPDSPAPTPPVAPDDSATALLRADETLSRTSILAGPVHGRVVDARTHEPVPFVDVRLVSGLVEETVTTPRDGTFRSKQEFPAEKLTAIVTDAGRAVLTRLRPKDLRAEDAWTIELAIGPTYPLVIEAGAPIDVTQWVARAVETTRNLENAGEIDVDDRGLRMSAPIAGAEDREWSWMTLRSEPILAGDVPWIRYPASEFEPDPRYRLRVQVRCETLGLKGLGRIRATIGAQEPALVDGLVRVGAIRGTVVAPGDLPASGATVMLLSREPLGQGDRTPQWNVAQTDEKGAFRFVDLAPGRRTLLAFAARAGPVERPVTIATGGMTELEEKLRLSKIDLLASDADASDAGSAKRDSRRRGRDQVTVHVRLPEAGRYARDWVRNVSDEALRSRTARLGAAGLPATGLDLEWLDLFESNARTRPAVTPMRMRIASPADTLNVSYGGWRDERELAFEVDGESEHPASFDLSFEPGGALIGERMSVEMRGWTSDLRTLKRWVAWRQGCMPVFGDERAFLGGKRRQDPYVAKIAFAPGWGAVLWCRATDGMPSTSLGKLGALGYVGDDASSGTGLHAVLASPPLPGVRALLDGTLAGTSDPEGVVRLAERRLPARLVLVADHWHLKLLQRLPQRSKSTQRYIMWMERDD